MAGGLLGDFFGAEENRLPLYMLAAAGKRSDGAGFGQRMAEALKGSDEYAKAKRAEQMQKEQFAMQQEMHGLSKQEHAMKIATTQRALANQQALLGMLDEGTAPAAAAALAPTAGDVLQPNPAETTHTGSGILNSFAVPDPSAAALGAPLSPAGKAAGAAPAQPPAAPDYALIAAASGAPIPGVATPAPGYARPGSQSWFQALPVYVRQALRADLLSNQGQGWAKIIQASSKPDYQVVDLGDRQIVIDKNDPATHQALLKGASPGELLNYEVRKEGNKIGWANQRVAQGNLDVARSGLELKQKESTPEYNRADYAAKAFGTKQGEAGAMALENYTKGNLQKQDFAEMNKLIDTATGSTVGEYRDKASAFFGKATPGSMAIGQLRNIVARMVLNASNMPKGTPSDKDMDLVYRGAAAIDDPKMPAEEKRAILKTAVAAHERLMSSLGSRVAGNVNPAAEDGANSGEKWIGSVPPASESKGRVMISKNGKRIVSDGRTWHELK